MAQWAAPIQGELYTVGSWHRCLTRFGLLEWASWMAPHPGTNQYTQVEWLQFWAGPPNRYSHPLEKTLAYLNEHVLLSVFRLAFQAAAQNRRREFRRL